MQAHQMSNSSKKWYLFLDSQPPSLQCPAVRPALILLKVHLLNLDALAGDHKQLEIVAGVDITLCCRGERVLSDAHDLIQSKGFLLRHLVLEVDLQRRQEKKSKERVRFGVDPSVCILYETQCTSLSGWERRKRVHTWLSKNGWMSDEAEPAHLQDSRS